MLEEQQHHPLPLVKNIRHYNNGTILTPHKCGTKYLNTIFNVGGHTNVIFYKDLFAYDFKWLIVRDPYEHLISGLTTVYNNRKYKWDLKKLLYNFINALDVHWNNTFYRNIYPHCLNHSFTLVELSNLTHFVEHELGLVPPKFLPKHGTEIVYLTKDSLVNKIKMEYPFEWRFLMGLVESERNYYKMLFDRCNVYSPEFSFS